MDLPQPPQDTELRNIIDKLAQFVARNGPEFEQMTKSKQKGNPKFQFLYGGEFYNYYQYKVTTEQAILRQQAGMNNNSNPPNPSWNPPSNNVPQNNTATLEQLTQQQETLKEQIIQSEQNLSAQHTVLLQQQQATVDATVNKLEQEELAKNAEAAGIDLDNLNQILQPIIESCTKDSISNGKGWILSHSSTEAQSDVIAHCLLYKVIHGVVPFSQKLHIIYLVNDVLHHCARKQAIELKKSLENVVVPMFCNASVGATDEQRNKLDKLLKLWESKANYLAPTTVEKLRQPAVSIQQYQNDQVAKYGNEVNNVTQQTKATFDGYQAQHQAFVSHAMQQILVIQQQKTSLENQNIRTGSPAPQTIPNTIIPPPNLTVPPIDAQIPSNPPCTNPPNPLSQPGIANQVTAPPPPIITQEFNIPPINPSVPPPILNSSNGMESIPFNQPPPGLPAFLPGGFPDFSKPPPGFPPTAAAPAIPPITKPEPAIEELMPSVPYYDLPAGLMIPLIKLDDASYKPIDPKAIRLPPPAPPSERLLAAVEAFYAIPSHDRPRDSEGWEKLGLYEYYKAKNTARKQKEDQIAMGLREKSRSPSPIVLPQLKEPSPPKRRYQSKSPSPQPLSASRRSRSRSPIRSSSKRRSKNKRRRSDSRSKSRSRSPPPRERDRDRDRSRDRERSGDRSRDRDMGHRSPTPPSFVNPFIKPAVQEIDESNKGHQMLRKMGWGGSGLGAKEQGIDAPIQGGDVRDRQDMYKGIGINLNDPYENFRKHKGAAFITRMKARAEERAQEKQVFQE